MGLYDHIEPTPSQVARIKALPADEPFLVISLLRLRTDLADGRAEDAWRRWQELVRPVVADYGIRRIAAGEAMFPLVGGGPGWDLAGVFLYPNPKALWRFMSDERTIEALKVRRAAAEDVHMLVMKPIPPFDFEP